MLYSHQQKIIDADPKKCGLFLGTGGGKTRVALSLAKGNTLVIMPKTQFLDENWPKEAQKINSSINLFCCSKEQFKKEISKSNLYFDTVIIDEAHTVLGATPYIRYRNKKPIPKASQIFEAVYEYLNRTKPERLYLCTATPARNPMTIWAAGILLGKDWNWNTWRRTFYFKLPMPGREIWQAKKDKLSQAILAEYTKSLGYVGRLEDWFDMPSQIDKFIHCPLTKLEEKTIKELPLIYPNPLVLIGKTHQVEQGLLLPAGSKNINSKLEAIDDLLLEYPKILIFARYVDQIGVMELYFKEKGIETYSLTGKNNNRKTIIEQAEKSPACVFIVQSQISTGFEVPSFRCTVFASMDYSYVNLVQAKGRNLRVNALNKNLYVYLHSGKIDEAVLKCMEGHQDFDERLYAKKRSSLSDNIQPVLSRH